jgi:3-hydroxybutyryl-CoA dehydratase
MDINQLKVGDKATITKQITKEMIVQFSELSEDRNPLHLDENFTKDTIFREPIAHGILVSSLISAVIANKLPGKGSIYLSQSLKFLKPVKHKDIITAEVIIDDIIYDKRRVKLITNCINENNEKVISGEALVML